MYFTQIYDDPDVDTFAVSTEPFITTSSSSSPTTSSETDSIYIQEGQMITFLKSDKGLEMFAKAHNITKDDVIHYLESKKNRDSFCCQYSSSVDHEEKADEGKLKFYICTFLLLLGHLNTSILKATSNN